MAGDRLDIGIGGDTPAKQLPPERIEFSSLSPLVRQLKQAAVVEAGIDTSPGAAAQKSPSQIQPLFALTEVTRRTGASRADRIDTVYRFNIAPEVADAVGRITAGLAGQPTNRLVPAAADHVTDGLEKAIRRGWAVQLVNGTTTPVFSADNPPPKLAQHPTRSFVSEIAVRVIRVGGKESKHPKARVQLLGSGGEASVTLPNVTAARALGNHLYEDVVLIGQGEWVVDPDRFMAPSRLLKFTVGEYQLLDPRSAGSAEELATVLGGVWDFIDPTDAGQMGEVFGRRK